VQHSSTPGHFTARHRKNGKAIVLGYLFRTQEEAAHAYDAAVRESGCVVVNFPQLPGEVQALRDEQTSVTLKRASGAYVVAEDYDAGAAMLYKGVHRSHIPGLFMAQYSKNGKSVLLDYSFRTQEEAARAYDAAVRQSGCLVVNFPQLSGEVQAVRDEKTHVTLKRAALAAAVLAPPPKRQRDPRSLPAAKPALQHPASARDDAEHPAVKQEFPGTDRAQLASLHGAADFGDALLSRRPGTPIPESLPPLAGEYAALFARIMQKPPKPELATPAMPAAP
jgi:hypothetical protein